MQRTGTKRILQVRKYTSAYVFDSFNCQANSDSRDHNLRTQQKYTAWKHNINLPQQT